MEQAAPVNALPASRQGWARQKPANVQLLSRNAVEFPKKPADLQVLCIRRSLRQSFIRKNCIFDGFCTA
jgi:hypothetical protein